MPDALTLDESETERLRVVYYPDLGGPVEVQWQECTGVTRGRKEWTTVEETEVPGKVVKVLAAQHLRTHFERAAKDAIDDVSQQLWAEAKTEQEGESDA